MSRKSEECPKCKGDGEISAEIRCLVCNGSGTTTTYIFPPYKPHDEILRSCAKAIEDFDRITPRPLTPVDQARAVLVYLHSRPEYQH